MTSPQFLEHYRHAQRVVQDLQARYFLYYLRQRYQEILGEPPPAACFDTARPVLERKRELLDAIALDQQRKAAAARREELEGKGRQSRKPASSILAVKGTDLYDRQTFVDESTTRLRFHTG